MKILFSPFSPYVRKCLVTAHEVGLIDRIELLPSNAHPVHRDAAIIADNPLGTVPTFFTDDGQVLYDSRVICAYLNQLGGGALIPQDATRWQTLSLQALGDGMLAACLLARYETVARPEAYQWQPWRTAQLDKVHTGLAHLERQMALLTHRIDLGSLTIGCLLWYLELRFADFGWRAQYPNVAQWYTSFSQRPSMAAQWQQVND